MRIDVSELSQKTALTKVERDSRKPKTEESETRDYRSPKSEADSRPTRALISSTAHRTWES